MSIAATVRQGSHLVARRLTRGTCRTTLRGRRPPTAGAVGSRAGRRPAGRRSGWLSPTTSLAELLHDTAEAVRAALAATDDWGLAGTRPGQYRSDLAADEAALAVLGRAEVGVLSEESGLHHGDRDVVVVIDPLDGSTNASRGVPWYAVSLCAVDADGPRASLVLDLPRVRRFAAVRGAGAVVDGRPLVPVGRHRAGRRHRRHLGPARAVAGLAAVPGDGCPRPRPVRRGRGRDRRVRRHAGARSTVRGTTWARCWSAPRRGFRWRMRTATTWWLSTTPRGERRSLARPLRYTISSWRPGAHSTWRDSVRDATAAH